MVQNASLPLVDLSKMYLLSKFEDFIPVSNFKTEINAIGNFFVFSIIHGPMCNAAFSRSSLNAHMEQV